MFIALTARVWTDSLRVPRAPPSSHPLLAAFAAPLFCRHLFSNLVVSELTSFWVWPHAAGDCAWGSALRAG